MAYLDFPPYSIVGEYPHLNRVRLGNLFMPFNPGNRQRYDLSCLPFFKFKKIRSVILSKRRKSREVEEWKVRNLYRCDACGYEIEEDECEEHDI